MAQNQIARTGSANIKSIAYFVTDHGYGHATRAAAVMGALSRENPGIRFEVFTTSPRWLFDDGQGIQYRYHYLKTDVGLIQSAPLEIDLQATVDALDKTLPFDAGTVAETASYLQKIDAQMIICDIAPIGICIADKSGIAAALVENFTWDWIYAGYHDSHEGLKRFSDYLAEIYAAVQLRIQVQPFCQAVPSGLKTNPVCRPISPSAANVRSELQIPATMKMVLLSMGGLAGPQDFEASLPDTQDVIFVVPGGSSILQMSDNQILLPPETHFHHPDLVNAADVVIGKVGYSTLAEVFQAGTPFGYLPRNDFRESAVLAEFIDRHIPSVRLEPEKFTTGSWHDDLSTLLEMPRDNRHRPNGARQVAHCIIDHL